MSDQTVIASHLALRVVKITLNRPKRLNALSAPLRSSLADALRTYSTSANAIFLESVGEDLKECLAPPAPPDRVGQ